jgi:uncharacterized protein (DUF433 family)
MTAMRRLAILARSSRAFAMNYQRIITIEPGKRGGRPCVRGLHIAVADVLGCLAAGMSHEEILADYPELTEEVIEQKLHFAVTMRRSRSAAYARQARMSRPCAWRAGRGPPPDGRSFSQAYVMTNIGCGNRSTEIGDCAGAAATQPKEGVSYSRFV